MEFDLVSNIESCYISIPHLSYYSHIPTTIIALILGFFVFFKDKNKDSLTSKILLFTAIAFSIWSVLDLYLWVSVDSRKIMFSWSVINLIEMLASSSTLYFSYVFLEKKDAPLIYKLIIGLPILLFAIFIPTNLNITGFDSPNCEAGQGPLTYYFYFLEIAFLLWLFIYLVRKIIATKAEERKMTIYFSLGALFFLASFSGTNIVGSLTENWQILQYGLFGMPVFMAFLVYIIIKYKAFNIRLLGAQALVVGIILLIGSQFAFIRNDTNRVLTGITLLIVILFGWWLVRSVKKEIKQKEELAEANLELKKLDGAKNEFLNIASHQLRTPVTVIKGVISMLQDGTMDSFDQATKNHFFDGAKIKCQKLEDIINDILHATSLINKKFDITNREMDKINIKEFFEKMIEGFKPETMKKKIELSISSLDPTVPEIYGQKNYLEEAFTNLISNAIKYTPATEDPAGQTDIGNNNTSSGPIKKSIVKVSSRKKGGFVIFSVKDNGIGIPPEAIPNLFKKFARAENAIKMYTDGTGLGLFIVKEVIEGHGGQVWIESQLGHGSEFFVKLPIKPVGKVNITEYIKERADMKI